jgi:predicted enzyme related to lactoylglutathione lyase
VSTVPFPIEYVESHGKPFAMPQAVVVHSRRADDVGRWYRQFGFEVFRQQTDDGQTYLTARCNGLLLKILTAGMSREAENTTLYFVVDDFEAALGAVAALNAMIMTPPLRSFGNRRIILADPDGRKIVLTERVPTAMQPVASQLPVAAPAPNQAAPPCDVELTPALGRITSATSERTRAAVYDEDEQLTEQEQEQRTFERAFDAVLRGAKTSLIAYFVYLTAMGVFIYLLASLPRPRDLQWLNTDLVKLPKTATVILLVLSLAAKVMASLPGTSRVNYGGLWTAIGIEGAICAMMLVVNLAPGPTTHFLFNAASALSLITPILYLYFLAQFMGEADRALIALHAYVMIFVYFSWAATAAAATLFFKLSPDALKTPPKWLGFCGIVFGLITLACGISYFVLLIRVAMSKKQRWRSND